MQHGDDREPAGSYMGEGGEPIRAPVGGSGGGLPAFALEFEPAPNASVIPGPGSTRPVERPVELAREPREPTRPRVVTPDVLPALPEGPASMDANEFAALLASIHAGARRVGFERRAPAANAVWCETMTLDESFQLPDLFDYIARNWGGGTYRLRPFDSKGGFAPGSATIRFGGAPKSPATDVITTPAVHVPPAASQTQGPDLFGALIQLATARAGTGADSNAWLGSLLPAIVNAGGQRESQLVELLLRAKEPNGAPVQLSEQLRFLKELKTLGLFGQEYDDSEPRESNPSDDGPNLGDLAKFAPLLSMLGGGNNNQQPQYGPPGYPQQYGYPPPGYPPQQYGYPPPGYPPQQYGYPPPGYPQQPGGPPPPGYPPQQPAGPPPGYQTPPPAQRPPGPPPPAVTDSFRTAMGHEIPGDDEELDPEALQADMLEFITHASREQIDRFMAELAQRGGPGVMAKLGGPG